MFSCPGKQNLSVSIDNSIGYMDWGGKCPPNCMSFQELQSRMLSGNRVITDVISKVGIYSGVERTLDSRNWCPYKREETERDDGQEETGLEIGVKLSTVKECLGIPGVARSKKEVSPPGLGRSMALPTT